MTIKKIEPQEIIQGKPHRKHFSKYFQQQNRLARLGQLRQKSASPDKTKTDAYLAKSQAGNNFFVREKFNLATIFDTAQPRQTTFNIPQILPWQSGFTFNSSNKILGQKNPPSVAMKPENNSFLIARALAHNQKPIQQIQIQPAIRPTINSGNKKIGPALFSPFDIRSQSSSQIKSAWLIAVPLAGSVGENNRFIPDVKDPLAVERSFRAGVRTVRNTVRWTPLNQQYTAINTIKGAGVAVGAYNTFSAWKHALNAMAVGDNKAAVDNAHMTLLNGFGTMKSTTSAIKGFDAYRLGTYNVLGKQITGRVLSDVVGGAFIAAQSPVTINYAQQRYKRGDISRKRRDAETFSGITRAGLGVACLIPGVDVVALPTATGLTLAEAGITIGCGGKYTDLIADAYENKDFVKQGIIYGAKKFRKSRTGETREQVDQHFARVEQKNLESTQRFFSYINTASKNRFGLDLNRVNAVTKKWYGLDLKQVNYANLEETLVDQMMSYRLGQTADAVGKVADAVGASDPNSTVYRTSSQLFRFRPITGTMGASKVIGQDTAAYILKKVGYRQGEIDAAEVKQRDQIGELITQKIIDGEDWVGGKIHDGINYVVKNNFNMYATMLGGAYNIVRKGSMKPTYRDGMLVPTIF